MITFSCIRCDCQIEEPNSVCWECDDVENCITCSIRLPNPSGKQSFIFKSKSVDTVSQTHVIYWIANRKRWSLTSFIQFPKKPWQISTYTFKEENLSKVCAKYVDIYKLEVM